jgi:hypothetical protein
MGVRVAGIVALVIAGALLVAQIAVPTCRNYAGTARDSGYPCKIDRSSGATDFVLSRATTITLPLAWMVIIGFAVLGCVLIARSRRR